MQTNFALRSLWKCLLPYAAQQFQVVLHGERCKTETVRAAALAYHVIVLLRAFLQALLVLT
jgi:hypothetical protein